MRSIIRSLTWPTIMGVVPILLAFLVLAAPVWAAHQPTDVVRAGTIRAAEALRSERLPNPAVSNDTEFNRLAEIAGDFFDFEEMGRRVLGRHWKIQAPEKRQEFIRLFNHLLYTTYIDKVEDMKGAQIEFCNEEIDGRYATVQTRAPYRQNMIEIKFRLKMRNEDWRVYDVVVEGISLIHNYRSQFNSILSRQSFDDLLALLKEKVN